MAPSDGILGSARLARAQRRPFRPHRRLRDLVRRDRRVALDAELELDLRQRVQLTIELAQLLLGVPADRIADLDVLATSTGPALAGTEKQVT